MDTDATSLQIEDKPATEQVVKSTQDTTQTPSIESTVVTEAALAKMKLKLFGQPANKPSKLSQQFSQLPACLEQDQDLLEQYKMDMDHFICKSCNFVAKEPETCRKCNQLFCGDCTSQNGKKMCPSCKDDSQAGRNRIAKLDPFATRHLQTMRFNCPHADKCGRVNMKYSEALAHATQCLYEYYHCPFGCVQKKGTGWEELEKTGIQGAEMFKHLENCDFNQIQCPKCSLWIVVKDKDKHDCMTELKKLIQEKTTNVQVTKEEFGIDFDRLNLRCDNNHQLACVRGKPLSHAGYVNGAQCNKCRANNLEHHEHFYHCKICNFDLCKACALQKGKMLGNRIKSQLHKCELTYVQPSRGYRCDCGYERGSNNDLTEVRCLSGHIAFYQGQYTQRWQCRACDFDMCIKCCEKFAFKPIQDITAQDCQMAYFILQSSIFAGDNDVHINRFLVEDQARDYYLRIQRKAMNSNGVAQENKFGIMLFKGRVLAKYGSVSKINKLIEDIKTNDSFYRYKKLFGVNIDDIGYHINRTVYFGNQSQQNKTSVLTKMHKDGEKDQFYQITQGDVIVQFEKGKMKMLQYKTNDQDGKRYLLTDYILELAKKEGAYQPPAEDSQPALHSVYWITKKKEDPVEGQEAQAATFKDVIFESLFESEEEAVHFYQKLVGPQIFPKLLLTDQILADSVGEDEEVQKLIDKASEDGTFNM